LILSREKINEGSYYIFFIMKYDPELEIDLEKIRYNLRKVRDLLRSKNADLMFVTKVTQGDPRIARIGVEEGIEWFGEARIDNIIRLRKGGIDKKIMQIRPPQISEITKTVKYADAAVITEIEVAKLLSKEAKRQGKKFQVLLMIEMGDLREGIMPEDVVKFAKEVSKMDNIEIIGIGMNLGCLGGVIPTKDKMEKLLEIKDKLEDNGINIEIVSGGATDTLYLFENNEIRGINQLRIGEAIFLGRDTTNNRIIPYLRNDAFKIKAEIIEIKEKPSRPYGKIGRDAFGNVPEFEDLGLRKRAVLAIGKEEIEPQALIPVDKDIRIIGSSSNHTVIDITDSKINYRVGDIVEFYPLYPSLMRAFLARHVKKKYL